MPTKYPASVLVDTNILLRVVTQASPLHGVTTGALRKLLDNDVNVYICPQNMQEFRQVATRPLASNGFGWTSAQTAAAMNRIEADFSVVQETPSIYATWRRIVELTGATGRANFDARIVAIAEVNSIAAVMTFESAAFARYGAVTNVVILDPATI